MSSTRAATSRRSSTPAAPVWAGWPKPGLDLGVVYAATVRPFDRPGLRAAAAPMATPGVVLVEPYLAGTSLPEVTRTFEDRAHRALGLGVGREEVRRYGEAAQHDRLHGLDRGGIRRSVEAFVG